MMLIFDFDHTVFDMMTMHQAMEDAVVKLGIERQLYRQAYDEVTHWKIFTAEALAQRLHRLAGVEPKKVIDVLNEISSMAELFLYDDTVEVLKKLRAQGHEVYLLSWGDQVWQMNKIENSGLKPHCNDVISVTQLKAEHLKNFCKDGCTVAIIDDKPAELKAAREIQPQIHLVRMRRPGAKYSDLETPQGAHEVKNMQEVLDLIATLPEKPAC